MTRITTLLAATALPLAAAIAPTAASAQADDWKFQGAVYGYFPSISGTTAFPPSGGSAGASVDIDTILDNLKFTFMGSLEARKGAWGAYTDVIYLDVGGSKTDVRSLALGGVVPAGATATVNFDLQGWAWTVAGNYRALTDADFTADIVFGVRQLDVKPKLGWQFCGNVGSIALQDRAGNLFSPADGQTWNTFAGALPGGMTIEELRDYLWADTDEQQGLLLQAVLTRLNLPIPATGVLPPRVRDDDNALCEGALRQDRVRSWTLGRDPAWAVATTISRARTRSRALALCDYHPGTCSLPHLVLALPHGQRAVLSTDALAFRGEPWRGR